MRPIIEVNPTNPDITGLVLYRCYGLDGTLMYIGATKHLRTRINQHRYENPWWFAVERITVQQYLKKKILQQDELTAIFYEQPYFNKLGKTACQPNSGSRGRGIGVFTKPGKPLFQGDTGDPLGLMLTQL